MHSMDNAVFDSVEKWAVRYAEGFVHGRLPAEDAVRIEDFVSRLTFANTIERSLPSMRPLDPQAPFAGQPVSAGPFKNLWSVEIPQSLSDLFGLPRDTGNPQLAKVVSIQSNEPLVVHRVPTCTDRDVFKNLAEGDHPPHPVIEFMRPVDHVHVRLLNDRDKVLWDASYDVRGGRFLNNQIKEAISEESPVPDFIAPCAVNTSNLKLQIDVEDRVPIKVEFYNPNNHAEAARYREEMLRSQPLDLKTPQEEIERSDAVVCNVNKLKSHAASPVSPGDRKESNVFIPKWLSDHLWRFDRTREEASDKNPGGIPMVDITGGKQDTGPSIDPFLRKLAPTAIGSGKQAVHLIPRRPPLRGEIQVDQLERSTFHLFDSRKMPTDIRQVDRTAVLHTPGGLIQPTVKRTVYSPMWQGIHGTDPKQPLTQQFTSLTKNIHPSLQFKHPVSVAHVQLTDLSTKKVLWDAFFDVAGNHKIAADQVPIRGPVPKFEGINPLAGKTHVYALRVDADNPADRIPSDRLGEFWRYSEFLFGATRPVSHSEVDIQVTNVGAPYFVPPPVIRA